MSEPSSIKLIVFDVDGVLTDGAIVLDDNGVEAKHFYVRDGFAIRAAQEMGLKIAALTGRASRCVTLRLSELGVKLQLQGVHDKAMGLETICQWANLLPEQCAYVGDDLMDLPPMLRSGYPMSVVDAVEEVKAEARYVTETAGGRGAAREAIEHLLKLQGRWEELLARYGL